MNFKKSLDYFFDKLYLPIVAITGTFSFLLIILGFEEIGLYLFYGTVIFTILGIVFFSKKIQ